MTSYPRHNGSLYVSGKLPNYPSPKPTLTLNVRGGVGGQFPREERYRKIPKISPGSFSKTLFEGLIFGEAYLRREICVSKSIGLAL